MRRFFRGILKTNAGSKPPWRTPDHPPYSEMVEVALRALSEEGGSTESSISAYIESTFTDLPWGHDRLLPYYLGKLVVSGEISSPSHDHYLLSLNQHHLLSSAHSLVRRRGRTPIYRPNPRSYPSFKSPPSASPRRPRRSRVSRCRGRQPEISVEGTPMLHLEQRSAPPRQRRGRPPLQRGGAVGGAIRRSVPPTRRSRGSRIRQDGVRGRKLSNNRGCGDNSDCFELIHAQSSPGKLQSLLLPGPNFSSPELPNQGEWRQFPNACAWHCSPEISAFRNGKKDAGSETCALQPMQDERGEGHRLVASPQPEHGEGQLFAVSLLSEHGEGKFSAVREVSLLTLEPAKVSYCPSLEHSEHSEGKSSQREAGPSSVLEQTEPSEEQTSPGELPTILSPEKPENDGRCPEITENDGHGPEMLENDGHGPEKPENDGHGPEKPGNDGHGLEKPGNDGHGLEKPENDDNGLEKPENDDHDLEKLENDGHGREKPENDDHGPENSENYVHGPEKPGRCPEKPENNDRGPEKPENDGCGPEKPENDGCGPEKPENDDHGPEKPENNDQGPEKPENNDRGPEKPENNDRGPEKPENNDQGPDKPENVGHGSEKLENVGHGSEKYENKQENNGHSPEKLENDAHGPAMPGNDDHGLEKPEEDRDKCSPGKRTAMVALDQEVLVPLLLPDPDEVGSSGASNKKKKSHGKRRRLKLWFEG